MRISKFTLPALTVAGALALAGCGGGSDSMGDMGDNGGSNGTGGGNGGATGFNVADLPEDAAGLIVYSPDLREVYRVAPDSYTDVGGTNLAVHCPEGAEGGCRWRVTADNEIEVTNGAEVILASEVPAAPGPSGGASPDSVADGNWLSDENLIDGVNDAGNRISLKKGLATYGAVGSANGLQTITAPENGGLQTEVRLRENRVAGTDADNPSQDGDYLVWGTWETGPANSDLPGPKPTRGVLWAGSEPHGSVPATSLDSANYVGAVIGFQKVGSTWRSINLPGTGTVNADNTFNDDLDGVHMRANFATGYIDGRIRGTGLSANDSEVLYIDLKQVKIGAGKFGAGTEVVSITPSGTEDGVRNASSSGSWEAQFFGPTSAAPTGIAGDFKATRSGGKAGATGTADAPAYEVIGAFGSNQ